MSLLKRMKEESEKAGLKLNIQKSKIMASGSIISWLTEREKVKTVADFIFLGSKITVATDWSRKIKICLLLERKAVTNLDIILKSRDISLTTKVQRVKVLDKVLFPVVLYGCASWSIKKPEHRRIDTFNLRCWRRLLGVSWIARRSSQLILKEINHEYSLEGLMLKLKLQYFGPLLQRADSLEKTLMLGKIECKRRRADRGWDGWMVSLTQCTWVWTNSGREWRTGKTWSAASYGSVKSQTQLSNWTSLLLHCN